VTLLSACAAMPRAERDDDIRVAACQIVVDGDRERCFERIDAALARAAGQGAHLACFPEACFFGWVNPTARALAHPIPGPTTDRLAALARRHRMMLAIGLAERDRDRLYNAAVLIGRDGSLLLHHRKVNIFSKLMTPPYTPGPDAKASIARTSS
jgi:predicted amidohydrolase